MKFSREPSFTRSHERSRMS